MINIQVAGAGAGKTYGLAKELVERCNQSPSTKVVFAITYTNAAKKKIEEEVISQLGSIPSCLKIDTVHSFLLNEVVYPYSQYVTGDMYNQASIAPLPTEPKFKNHKINRLKNLNVIHSTKVFSVSRKILDKSHSSNKSRAKKLKVDKVISIIKSCVDRIYLDEVQDLDPDGLNAFANLGLEGLYIYMIGDPKQAIKYPRALTEFIRKISTSYPEKTNIPKPNNITRRVPTEILAVSNNFCYPNQQQESSSDEVGELLYINSTHQDYDQFIRGHIKSNSLICIDKKAGKYSTAKKINGSFDPVISGMIASSSHGRDPELMVNVAHAKFCDDVMVGGFKNAYRSLCKDYSITPEPQEYRITESYSESILSSDSIYSIKSIDAVKGLDAETCVVVLSPSFYKYFLQSNLSKTEEYNKVWKLVYVALTRAKKQLIFVIDPDILVGLDLNEVRREIASKGFTPIE
jgi:superfamily I DNA/RNA helicase